MSGIEAANFVLAAIPICTAAIGAAKDSIDTIEHFWKWKLELPHIISKLEAERLSLLLTMRLLILSVRPLTKEIDSMFEDPQGALWTDTSIVTELQSRHKEAYAIIESSIRGIASLMEKLMTKLGLEMKKTVSCASNAQSPQSCFARHIEATPSDESRQLMGVCTEKSKGRDLQAIMATKLNITSSFAATKRFIYSISQGDIRHLLFEMHLCQQSIDSIFQKSERLAGATSKVNDKLHASLELYRRQALTLHTALSKAFAYCNQSTNAHSVRMLLEQRLHPGDASDLADESSRYRSVSQPPNDRKTLIVAALGEQIQWSQRRLTARRFSLSTARHTFWRHAEIRIVEPGSDLPPIQLISTKPQSVKGICPIMHSYVEQAERIGLQLSPRTELQGFYSADCPSPSRSQSRKDQPFVTLQQLLSQKPVPIHPKDTHYLALTLASSLFQLRTTPWLCSGLSKEDITFSWDKNCERSAILLQPHVTKTFDRPHAPQE